MSMKNARRYPFQVQHDGLCLDGEIVYTSKDYHIALLEPFYARNAGLGLMYVIPARYTTPLDGDRDSRTDGVIRLEERAEDELIEIYETYKDTPFEEYLDWLFLPHKESLCALFHDSFVSIRAHEECRRSIKEQYASGMLTNKEQSQQTQKENQSIEEIQREINDIFEQYCVQHSIQIPPIHRRETKNMIKRWQQAV